MKVTVTWCWTATDVGLATTVATKTENQDDGLGGDENKKKANGIALTRKTGRVTVILPPKKSAESQTPNPGT